MKEDEKNTYWKIAKSLNLKEKLSQLSFNVAIQGELIGEGIQANLYKIRGQKVKVFDIFNIDEGKYLSYEELTKTCKNLELETVPVIDAILEFNRWGSWVGPHVRSATFIPPLLRI